MRNNSPIEDLFEIAIKNPVAGFVLSVVFACGGFYLSHKTAPGAKPADLVFSPLHHFLGGVLYMLSVAVLIFSGIGYVVTSVKKKKQTAFFGTRRTLEDIKNLSWKQFEEFVGSLFVKMGYDVEVTGGLDDGGIDLIVKKDGKTSFVQCKKYQASKVSLSMVRDFYGAMNANLNFEAGYFITTGMFTLEARHFADDKPIELIDGPKLMDYVRLTSQIKVPSGDRTLNPVYSEEDDVRLTSKKEVPQESVPVSSVKSTKVPVCPKCGVNMVLRTAKKGGKIGSQFWGCPNYPRCKATKFLSTE